MQPTRNTALEQLRRGWTPARLGRSILWLDEASSTNLVAMEAAGEPDQADGLIVLAESQTTGRGRQGRAWLSPRGASILCSVRIVEPVSPAVTPQALAGRLTMLVAVAACEAIAQATEVRPAIKWPNDLRVAGKKIGGILIESKPLAGNDRAWVLGFGINCLQHAGHFPPEIAATATSLELAASHPIDRIAVARALLMQLDRWLTRPDWRESPELYEAWLAHAEPIGQRMSLRYDRQDYTGRTISVDPLGGLTLQLDNGRQMWFDPMQTSVL